MNYRTQTSQTRFCIYVHVISFHIKNLQKNIILQRPPHSIELFSADQVRLITEYTVNSYFRHFKMYKYAFTPLVSMHTFSLFYCIAVNLNCFLLDHLSIFDLLCFF